MADTENKGAVDTGKYTNEVTTNFFKIGDPDDAKEGDEFTLVRSIAGVLLESGSMDIQGNPVGRYKIETDEGEVTFIGTTMIDDKMSRIEVGTDVMILFDGYEKSKGAGRSPMKKVRVLTA